MTNITRALSHLLLYILFTALYACSDEEQQVKNNTLPAQQSYVEIGDLEKIKQHGQLRILIMPINEKWLPSRAVHLMTNKI